MNIQSNNFETGRDGAEIVVARREDLTWFDAIAGERMTVHVRAEQSGGAYTILESVAAPGAAAPLHYHREDEIFFVIEGLATFSVDGTIHRVGPGSTIVVPAGIVHGWKNKTTAPVRMLATFTPGGIETMFEQLAGKTMDEIIALAATYGTHVVGPPIA